MKRIVIIGGGFAGLSETETVLGCKRQHPGLRGGEGETFFLDIPFYRTTYKTRVALEKPCKKR
jgi:hypothetical protein